MQMENALEENKNRINTVFNAIDDAIFSSPPSG